MANYISKINIAGATYDIYDKEARELLAKTLVFVGVTTTAVSDGAATPSTYGGLAGITIPPGHTGTDTLDAGTVVIYNQKEFVWDGSKWAEFGDLSDLSLSTTTGNFVTGATATPTNTATNTGAGTAHSHGIPSPTVSYLAVYPQKTQALVTESQSASIVGTVATGTLSTTSGAGKGDGVVASLNTQKLVTDTVTNWTAATAKNVASAGTAVGVFNSITSTQGDDGIKVITDVSGGGQAGEVTTEGVAASIATTVLTALNTSNATATGRIPYTAGVTTTNKLVTSQFTPVAVGASVTVFSSFDSMNIGGDAVMTDAANLATQQYLGYYSISAVYDDSTLPSNIFTLYLPSSCADGIGSSTNNWGHPGAFHWGHTFVRTASITPAIAGTTAITYATGSVGATGSGSAVATGGTTSYLYATSSTQTTNTPTVVSFGTVVINGTPSYIHTSNIVPAVANGTIVGLNTSAAKTFATGSTATNGSGSTVAIGGTTKYMNLDTQNITIATTVATGQINISGSGAYLMSGVSISLGSVQGADTYGPIVTAIPATTSAESAHTHSYSKVTAISVSAPTASAITSVSLVPAS